MTTQHEYIKKLGATDTLLEVAHFQQSIINDSISKSEMESFQRLVDNKVNIVLTLRQILRQAILNENYPNSPKKTL